ncbi:MAG: Competence protein ComEC [Candidatus Tokpelaia hoelldobleri]|uniref:Competence protein ComEC n=1 Tax=Candidatus Tokpelaia hoelldobleri TaxID=1902579 RepID=A0A1U9JUD6_9HYPH|nr:MAG: Competence protein ComEC [Candidatus Tokpelaia hoelldoblerii]
MPENNGKMPTDEQRQWAHVTGVPPAWRPSGLVISVPDDVFFPVPEKQRSARFLRVVQGWLALEEAYGVRFLLVPVFAAAGVISYFSFVHEISWLRLVALALLMGALACLFRRIRFVALGFGFLAIAVAGALCARLEAARVATIMLGNETTTYMTGRIVALEETGYGYRLQLDVMATNRPALSARVERVQLSARTLPEGLAIGDGLDGLVRLRPPSGPVLPGSYDFSFHAYFRGIGAQGFFMGKPDKVDVPPPDGLLARLQIRVARLRQMMTQRIHAAIGGEAGAISAALITGQRGGISKETHKALRLAGISHILSISGLHMAMVSGMVLVAARAFTGLFPVFSSRHAPGKIAAVAALGISAFYLVLSGADVAAQRSFVMVAVMLVAVLCDRAAITMRNLALAALVTILIVPHEILGPSFQMSFSATAVLIAAFQWWNRRKSRKVHKDLQTSGLFSRFVLAPLVGTIASSVLAGTASGIFAAYHFNNTAPLGVLGNAVTFPLMSVIVMPFALLGAVLMPLHLEWLPLKIMGLGVWLVQRAAYWVAGLSPDFSPGAFPSSALAAFSIALVLLVFLRSPLRIMAIAAFVYGVILCAIAPRPLALIAENARLVAVLDKNGRLAVNTSQPQAFVLSNWKAAFRAEEVLRPRDHENMKDTLQSGFVCETFLFCHAPLANGKILAIVSNRLMADKACERGDIVLLDYSGDERPCPEGLTISRRELALYGSAVLYDTPEGTGIIWASGEPERPWNAHRRFAKAARGMP